MIINQIGSQISNTAFVYEALIALVDVGDDCTVGDVKTDIPDFRRVDEGRRPVEAYWVDVTNRIESIRYVSISLGVLFLKVSTQG